MMADMREPTDPTSLCRHWFADAPLCVTRLPATGFSGAAVFRVDRTDTGERFVFKRFGESATLRQAEWVHALARHLRGAGIDAVPRVLEIAIRAADVSATLLADTDGAVWEMVEFKPGVPLESPAPAEAAAAAALLARVHRAAARLPGWTATAAVSPGLVRRIERCRELVADPWSRRLERLSSRGAVAASDQGLAAAVADRLVTAVATWSAAGVGRLVAEVARLEPPAMPLGPVLRDVWCDHVLFVDPGGITNGGPTGHPSGLGHTGIRTVSGIIDLHAAGVDTPATDLARLLGSWTPPAGRAAARLAGRWPEAFAAYEAVRPLAAEERGAIWVLHAAGVVVSLDNWFRWTLDEGRSFPERARVLARIDRLVAELPFAGLSRGAGARGAAGIGD